MPFLVGFKVEKFVLKYFCLRVLRFCAQSVPLHSICPQSVPLHSICPQSVPLHSICPQSVPLHSICPQSVPLHRISMLPHSAITEVYLLPVSSPNLKTIKIYCVRPLTASFCFCLCFWPIFVLFCCMFSNINPSKILQCARVKYMLNFRIS